MLTDQTRWSLGHGKPLVPSRWQATLSDYDNDMFRAVHDAFGHAAIGCGFDEHGEEAAWLAHSYLYSPLARQALTTETRGQNCALIYGSHGEGFPVQKIALLPEEFAELGNVSFISGSGEQ